MILLLASLGPGRDCEGRDGGIEQGGHVRDSNCRKGDRDGGRFACMIMRRSCMIRGLTVTELQRFQHDHLEVSLAEV